VSRRREVGAHRHAGGATAAPRTGVALLLATLAALAALAVGSCGGGGGGGGGPTGPPPAQSSITFTPAGGGSGISLASGAATQGTTLTLDLRSSGIQDLYGVAFHLSYPSAVMHFVIATQGSVLNGGGAVGTSLQAVETSPGNLVVGLTRLGPVAGTSAAGTLLTLQFGAVATGSGTLAFSSNLAADSGGNPIAGVAWSAGAVQATIVPGSAAAVR
jgi:hypothetical protein